MYRHNTLFGKIEEARIKYNLFDKKDKILICLSGGADSTALLVSVCEFYPDANVYACHVNHSLRGVESDADECFAKELAEKLGVKFFSTKIDVNSYAKKFGLSTELAARNLRYSFFEKICSSQLIVSFILSFDNPHSSLSSSCVPWEMYLSGIPTGTTFTEGWFADTYSATAP